MTRCRCQENGGMFCLRGRCPADALLACHLQQVDPLEGTVQCAMAWGHPFRVLRMGHADLPLTLLWGCLRCETGQKCQKVALCMFLVRRCGLVGIGDLGKRRVAGPRDSMGT